MEDANSRYSKKFTLLDGGEMGARWKDYVRQLLGDQGEGRRKKSKKRVKEERARNGSLK